MRTLGPVVAVVLFALTACAADPAPSGHSHDGSVRVSLPVGDGTRASEVGYSLTGVDLPEAAGETGEVRFRVEDFRGRAVTDYVRELTKDLHLYVVREDLGVFRHLHPTVGEDGTWTAPLSLPAAGDYRVIAEFVAKDAGGNGDHVVLGDSVPVTGGTDAAPDPEPVLAIEATEEPAVGRDGRLTLRVRDDRGRPVRLETYLGAHGHVTGFHRETGSMVHLHPWGTPQTTEAGSELTFHTEIEQPGDYLLYAQVRVDGYLHTVPVTITVSEAA